ncbi:MAG: T9SS type A sorting domain-containing protein [Candidatus Eisenbacteria sp.]|nr:T9SS type A sorting domain-containing protein [Candidatus Eisenbacteria bacterium]
MRRHPALMILVLLGLSLAMPPVLAASAAEGEAIHVRLEGQQVVMTYTGTDGIAGELPVVSRLVPVPAGVETLVPGKTRCETGGTISQLDQPPAGIVTVGSAMSFRGNRWIPVTLRPHGLDADTGEIIRYDRVEIVLSPAGQVPFKGSLAGPVDATPSQALYCAIHQDGTTGYLIITAPQYADALDPLSEWKRLKGYDVTVATTDETGVGLTSIKNYIRNAYETWDNPPLYVLLVGDVDDIPTDYFGGDVTDHVYVLADDEDYLPDLFIGRFSVEDTYQAETMVAKTVNYERHPYTDEGTDWFSRALMVAGDYGSATPVQTSRFCAESLFDAGFTSVDSVYAFEDGSGQWDGVVPITTAVNSGLTVINYRGWAFGTGGWQPPEFQTVNIGGLSNGWKLPVVFSCVCHTGNFGADAEAFGEAWVRSGSPTEPRGAVAFVGNGDPWSYTRWNDRMAMGLYESMRVDNLRRVGPIMTGAKIRMIEQFPSELWFADSADQSVEFYFYIYNLQGDPELNIWTAAPQEIEVVHPSSVPVGTGFIEITVEDAKTKSPIPGARIGIVQGNQVLGSAHTDSRGVALVPAIPDNSVDSLNITVTGMNLAPYEGVAAVTVPEAFLAYADHDLDDDDQDASDGNDDGVLNPGETVEIELTLRNTGTTTATSVTAAIDSIWGAQVLAAAASFGDIAAGSEGTSSSPLVLSVDTSAEDGFVIRVGLDVSFGASSHSVSYFTLQVSAPDPLYLGAVASADSILDAGETANMTVRLANTGSADASGVEATLRTSTPWITITDSVGTFGTFAVGDTVENTTDVFEVVVSGEAATGQAAGFEMELTTDEGGISTVTFAIIVGRVDHCAPMGPDAYGYYCYDNTDVDYDASPVFDWIPCSPAYGGLGENLYLRNDRLKAIGLPFDFVFYGVSYDSILVSDNGWFSFDLDWYRDFNNWHLPDSYGNFAMVAPFWENLNPRRRINDIRVADGAYTWADTAGHRFVVEWSRIPYWDEMDNDDLQTFEVILYDQEYLDTVDGEIVFQYKRIVDIDLTYQQATVGIEDHTETVGLEYVFSGVYPGESAALSNGLAVKFTTRAPSRIDTGKEVALAERPGLASWPNPFNPSTVVRYSLPREEHVTISIYDILGRQVAELANGVRPAGPQEIRWDATGFASGVYFCRLKTQEDAETIKIMLLK